MTTKTKSVSLAHVKRLVSEKVLDPMTAPEVFMKAVLFLERNSRWKRKRREPLQGKSVDEMVMEAERKLKQSKGGLQ